MFTTIKRITPVIIGIILFLFSVAGSAQSPAVPTEKFVLATWNIEHFMMMFDQEMMPERSRNETEYFRDEEDLYEIARTMNLEKMNADVVLIQEGPTQTMLELFNRKWLKGKYAYVKVFEGNTEGQYLGMLAREGFKALEVRVYDKDLNPFNNKLLFSRGPGFVLMETPGGTKVWLGTTHAKSKTDNSKGITEWRIRELTRTREICGELVKEGKADYVLIGGDFNDDFGKDSFEQSLGQDAAEVMVQGTDSEKLICLDERILKENPDAASYHCEIKPVKFRAFLDHYFVSPALADRLREIYIIEDPIAVVASDHLPLIGVFDFPRKANPNP
jgi:endonuclease/exonuclease/phosphatase family metal-dependent hydrolase